MTIFIQLTIAGADVGPFNLYSDVDGFLTPFETNISRQSLIDGFLSTAVPTGTKQVKVQSMASCTNYVIVTIIPATTTTSTTTAIPYILSYTIRKEDCGECPKSSGTISVNGTVRQSWVTTTPSPTTGTLSVNVGDIIDVEGDCYVTGVGCIGIVDATLEFLVDSIGVADVVNDVLSYSFTIANTSTTLEIVTGCQSPP